LEEDLAWLETQSCDVIVSIAGETVDEYGALARRLRGQRGIKAIEVNISCPNVANRGQVFSCDPVTARAAIEAVRINLGGDFPIIAKLSPDVTDIVAIAAEVIDAGADGLALINTLLGMVINTKTLRPHLAGKTGGLSGPAIRPVAVRAIYQVRERFPTTAIIGMGGVVHGEDALELVAAGANAVSIGTASFGNPMSAIEVRDRLGRLLSEHGFSRFHEAVGIAHER
jgi:dihydroorotate dehydrogenase (NAD+) catalytic subunit